MIPAPEGIVAYFKDGDSDRVLSQNVIAFDDDGTALVLPNKGDQLVAAGSFRNFHSLDFTGGETDEDTITAVPGGGWMAEYKDPEDGTLEWNGPVVAWLVDRSGFASPIVANDCNSAGTVEAIGNKMRIYYPEPS